MHQSSKPFIHLQSGNSLICTAKAKVTEFAASIFASGPFCQYRKVVMCMCDVSVRAAGSSNVLDNRLIAE